ncbi:hypothetical protein [Parapedobacter tibetensis]|uniref:hypothetical protein n=1 Tax=Parapedobacter tibetensis TaxID=2972951 RepID=UPI00214DD486|nr:hypothetical protein [Parapedobacter tibetensis]
MKLSIEDLMVDSYAVQLCEQELTEIKGGTTVPCGVYVLVGTVITTIGIIVAATASKPKQVKTKKTTTTTFKKADGGDSTVVKEEYDYYPN